jgi:O-antigen/teichoic acid export membrane protein
MARARRFTHGVFLGILGQVITMVAGLWLSPFLLHRLGPAGYGFWIVGQQVLVYLTLMDLGVVALLPREVASVTGGESVATKLPQLISRTMRIVLLQTPVIIAASALLWVLIPQNWTTIRTPIGLAAIAFCVLFPTRIFRAVLDGLQDLAFGNWSYMASWFIGLVVSVGCVQAGFGLRALAIGWAANQGFDAIVCLFRIRSHFPDAWPSTWRVPAHSGVAAQFWRGLWVSVSQIAQVLIYGTDAAIIGRLFGAAAVVPYNCTGKLINTLQNQPQHIMRSAGPGLTEMRVAASREKLADVTGALSLAMLFASGMVTTLTLAVNPSFVRWWIGGAYFGGVLLTVLFALAMLLRHLNITAIYALFAFGHERLLAITSLADGILSTILSILLAWLLHSAIGVVLGSILSTCCVLFFGNGRRLAKEIGVSVVQLGRPLAGWFWRMVLAGCAACLIGNYVRQPGPFQIAAVGTFAVSAYCLLMIPVVLRSALRPYIEPYLQLLRGFWSRRTLAFSHWGAGKGGAGI